MTPPALVAYRTRHTVRPVRDWDDTFKYYTLVCEKDGIRVYPVEGGHRHDVTEIRELARLERGEGVAW